MSQRKETKVAVIVVDMQTAMLEAGSAVRLDGSEQLVAKAQQVLAWARAAEGAAVCFVRHDDAEAGAALAPDSPGWRVLDALGQRAAEPTFAKSVGNAFSNPALGAWVGARPVLLLGAQSDMCVDATATAALALGLKVAVVSDAHGTVAYGGSTANQIIALHNAKWRDAGAVLVSADDLDNLASLLSE
ncbi:Cysteine hydrolase [Physocladia obscura]|uniref:Cysteine hydrolase n=1 Tax=Physocladia obscura TaxID=109957 RepID=A0AAD5XEI6_9FUNG|nr:Cysteine hydrolase [Physocladia obscura]